MSLERRLAIISLIPREPRSITANEVTAKLNHELDIPSELRTVQRDLLELSDVDALGLRFYEGEERTQPPSAQLALPVGRNGKNKKSNQTKRWYISKVISGMEIPSMDPYAATVLKLAEKLTAPINKFFDDVMVMDKDEAVKNNRLALLDQVRNIINAVGNLSLLVD